VLFSKQSLPPSQNGVNNQSLPGLISKTEILHQNENNNEVYGENDYEFDKHCKINELKHFFSDPKIALTDWMQVLQIHVYIYVCIFTYCI
jgi:hypothetical protein